jgi:hypothetical protein
MPRNSRRIYSDQRFRLSKVAEVPARYAYDWLTDYRKDDGKFSSSHPRYRVVKISADRIVRIRISRRKSGSVGVAVDLVRLSPPNAWHTDQIDETDLAAVDYKVTALGPKRARIELFILERWMTSQFPRPAEYRKATNEYWDLLVASLEKRYRTGRPATA